jgi:hypothetical protein
MNGWSAVQNANTAARERVNQAVGTQVRREHVKPAAPRSPREVNMGAATLGGLLADAAMLGDDERARLLALEHERHPSLAELHALGELEVDTAIAAGRVALGGDAGHPHLAAALDAAYRALASPRIVRAVVTAERIAASREEAPVRVREDEELVLLVLADNRTDATVEFSAECHGEGFGGFVEAGRTGSSLITLGLMPPGKYLVPVMVVADGRPTTVDVSIECGG